MARVLNRLTVRQVETLKRAGMHPDGGGLYLNIGKTGSKSWVLRYRWGERRRDMGLGSAEAVSLAQARQLATKARSILVKARAGAGPDPLSARQAQREAEAATAGAKAAKQITFGQIADEHIAAMGGAWSNEKHRAQWKYTLETLAADLRPRPIAEIDTEAVLAVLKPLWQSVPETASRLRGRIAAVLDRAKAKKLRTGENPAAWTGHLALLLPKRQKLTRGHHAALPYDKLPEFMAKLRKSDSLTARALEFTILTACRTGEVIGARWAEIDREKKIWTIPPQRMKAKIEHRVPLSSRALEIIEALAKARNGAFIFPGKTAKHSLTNMSMLMLLRDLAPGFTVHGFRSSFRDWAGETTGFPHEICEHALAHRISDKAEAAYRRGDALAKRAKLMQAWADYCEPRDIAKVVPLAKAKR